MTTRYSRQSFLGPESDEAIARCTVGVVGLGGGGSHVVQQLSHIGFQRYVLFDPDVVEVSNLNRLVGATLVDAKAATPKVHLAKTLIYGLQPEAIVKAYSCKWQDKPEALRECQIVFGCPDTYLGRHELEVDCRRYLSHYIDIGMDVYDPDQQPVIGGHVILSSPGGPCMRCMGFLTDEKLGREAAGYGDLGGRPQVVWPNGVLASTAVGIAIDLITNWTRRQRSHIFLSYNGNEMTVRESRISLLSRECPHHPLADVGEKIFTPL